MAAQDVSENRRPSAVDRSGDRGGSISMVLAVRWKKGPVLFIRHAIREKVAQEIALLGDNPHAEGLAACDALFEVSFLDLDEVLDESISLLDD